LGILAMPLLFQGTEQRRDMPLSYARRHLPRSVFGFGALLLALASAEIGFAQTTAGSGLVRIDDMLLPQTAVQTPGVSRPASVTGASFTPWLGGVAPIEFSSSISEANRSAVFSACAIWSRRAAVSCVARTNQSRYLRVTDDSGGCYANVGAPSGREPGRMNLDTACWSQKSILHELGHVFGLQHEHQRPDRDTYISIDTSAVDPSYQSAFTVLTGAPTRGAYDFLSVMHYHDFAFASVPLTRTMLPKPGFEWYAYSLGSSDFPSTGDGDAVQAIYGGGSTYWPARVQDLHVTQTTTAGTTIMWDPPAGTPVVTQYAATVYSGPSYLESSIYQTFTLAPSATGVTLNLPAGHYFMTVKGDSADGEYARSTVLTFSVSGPSVTATAPGSPVLTASPAGADRVALAWQSGPGAAPTLYTMYAGTTPGSNNLGSFPMGTSTSVTTTAPVGVTAYIRVVASNEVCAATSNEVSFYVPGTPSANAPSLHVQHANANPIALSWSSGVSSGPTSYTLLAGSAPGGADFGSFPMGSAESIVANAPVGVPLYVRVVETSAAGTMTSNEVQLQVNGTWSATPPTLMLPTVSGSTVQLAWNASDATAYTLLARAYPGGPVLASVPLGSATSISIPNVPQGTYFVTVAATPGFAESNQVVVSVS
jgi:hypothetical protein